MKSFCLKFLFVLFSCCFMVGVAYQIYLKLTFNYETTIVRSDIMEKKAEGIGVIFKDEVVLNPDEYAGIVKNNFFNGARVAAKSEVAQDRGRDNKYLMKQSPERQLLSAQNTSTLLPHT